MDHSFGIRSYRWQIGEPVWYTDFIAAFAFGHLWDGEHQTIQAWCWDSIEVEAVGG
jgi:hypothetical protein